MKILAWGVVVFSLLCSVVTFVSLYQDFEKLWPWFVTTGILYFIVHLIDWAFDEAFS
jgi:hypothetical protein